MPPSRSVAEPSSRTSSHHHQEKQQQDATSSSPKSKRSRLKRIFFGNWSGKQQESEATTTANEQKGIPSDAVFQVQDEFRSVRSVGSARTLIHNDDDEDDDNYNYISSIMRRSTARATSKSTSRGDNKEPETGSDDARSVTSAGSSRAHLLKSLADRQKRSGDGSVVSNISKSNKLTVIVLLIDPQTSRFEFMQMEFEASKAVIADIVREIPSSTAKSIFKEQTYTGLCAEDGKSMPHSSLAASLCKSGQILVAIPSGSQGPDIVKFARTILKDKKVYSMLTTHGISVDEWKPKSGEVDNSNAAAANTRSAGANSNTAAAAGSGANPATNSNNNSSSSSNEYQGGELIMSRLMADPYAGIIVVVVVVVVGFLQFFMSPGSSPVPPVPVVQQPTPIPSVPVLPTTTTEGIQPQKEDTFKLPDGLVMPADLMDKTGQAQELKQDVATYVPGTFLPWSETDFLQMDRYGRISVYTSQGKLVGQTQGGNCQGYPDCVAGMHVQPDGRILIGTTRMSVLYQQQAAQEAANAATGPTIDQMMIPETLSQPTAAVEVTADGEVMTTAEATENSSA